MAQQSNMMTAAEVAEALKVSISKAYSIVRQCNAALSKKGYYTVRGRVSRQYLEDKFFYRAGGGIDIGR